MDERLEELRAYIDGIEDHLEHVDSLYKDKIKLKSRLLDECLAEQPEMVEEYHSLRAHCAYASYETKMLKEQFHSYAFTVEVRQKNYKPSATEANQIADCNTDYIEAFKLNNRAILVSSEVDSRIEALKARGYSLKAISESVIASTNKHII